MSAVTVPAEDAVTFIYTNWRGKTAFRRIRAKGATFHFGSTEWHPEPQWLLSAIDLDLLDARDFALKDIVFAARPAITAGTEAGAVEIKPLKWTGSDASALGLHYGVKPYRNPLNSDPTYKGEYLALAFGGSWSRCYPTEAEGMAAAQADFAERVSEWVAIAPETVEAVEGRYNIEAIAKVISLSYGENPDDDAPLHRICGPNDEPLPCWVAYEEQAKAVWVWMQTVIDRLFLTENGGPDGYATDRRVPDTSFDWGNPNGLSDDELDGSALATPSPQPVDAVREALAGLEAACERLASIRSHGVYLHMLDDEGAGDALRSLDDARAAARAALASDPAPAGEAVEPVAWLCINLLDGRRKEITFSKGLAQDREGYRCYGSPAWEVSPLYAHPELTRLREKLGRESEESYEIGKRDGYEQAVQHIDERTGGDGEYWCVVGYDEDDRYCPDSASMIARIVGRFETLSDQTNAANLERDAALSQLDDARRENRTAREDERESPEAVAALARGYELMQRAIWNMAGTSGADAYWYRNTALAIIGRVDPLWKVGKLSNCSRPGDFLTQADKFLAALRASTAGSPTDGE